MIAFRRTFVLAVDAASVSGGTAARGLLGGFQITAAARVEFAAAALPPSTEAPSPEQVETLAGALRELAADAPEARTALVLLPDFAAALAVLEPQRGVDPAEHARFRLAPALDAPPAELVARVCVAPGGRTLAVGVRRSTLDAYRAATTAAGVAPAAVSFAAFAALLGLPAPAAAVAVDVVLGDAAITLLGWRGGALASARCRLRDPGADEAQRCHAEIRRTAAALGSDAASVRLLGPGATRLGAGLAGLGLATRAGLAGLRVVAPGIAAEDLLWPAALA